MVDGQVRTTDVTDPAILDAMLAIPREAFVDEQRRPLAYIDEDIEIAPGRYLMEAVALRQAGAACRNPRRRHRARCRRRHRLLVGRAVAAGRLGGGARKRCRPRRPRPRGARRPAATMSRSSSAPLGDGHAAGAPYDVIVVEGAVEVLPQALFAQLARRRPPGRGRRARQCRRCPPLPEIGWHRDRPPRLQCGSKATTRLRTYAGVRVLGMLSLVMRAAHVHVAADCLILVTGRRMRLVAPAGKA